uniref:Cation efflux protein transmembrane domain-containing protein n=1 Tax=Oryza punctata TaxID=4537 RepID=A0A0E0KNS1_ORYPU
MRRPFAAAAALRLRLRLLSSSSSATSSSSSSSSSLPRLPSSPYPLHHHLLLLSRRGGDGDDDPSPPPPFPPRPLLASSASSGVLGLGRWRTRALPPAPSPPRGAVADAPPVRLTLSRSYSLRVAKGKKKAHFDDEHSHVMLAELVHSVADFANQALLAYGLSSSRRAPDALHPYGYSKERFVWSLISAVGIFCLGSGATIVHGVQNLWNSQPPENIHYAALVIGGSFLIEGASLLVAIKAVKKGAAAEGMSIWDYIWRGHDPTSVAVMTEDGAAVTGLAIAAASLVAVQTTGNAMYDPIGSIIVGNLLGMVAIFLIQRNRHALIGRAIDDHDMQRVLEFLKADPVVDALYDCKSEVIGPGFFRFKAEIDFNGVVLVQNYLERTGRGEWAKQFREASMSEDDTDLIRVMSNYGEDVVEALGYEVDRLESEIQKIVPGIRHVDIEAHNPEGLSL